MAILLDWVSAVFARGGKRRARRDDGVRLRPSHGPPVSYLDIIHNTLDIKGNIVTFNIALKRLANAGKGILIDTLNEGLEPNVVSYTTTIGACSKQGVQTAAASI